MFHGDRRRLALANPVSIANNLGQVLRRDGLGGDRTVRREGMSPLQLSHDLFVNQSLLDGLPSLQALNLPEVEDGTRVEDGGSNPCLLAPSERPP